MNTRSYNPLTKTGSRQRAGSLTATSVTERTEPLATSATKSTEPIRTGEATSNNNKSNISGLPQVQDATWTNGGNQCDLKNKIYSPTNGSVTRRQGDTSAAVMAVNRFSKGSGIQRYRDNSSNIILIYPTINLQSATTNGYKLISTFEPEFLTE